jgi:hypothetical protein
MENKVTKFGLRKMLAVLAFALACVCMWGCSDDDYRRWGGRYEGTLVAIIDDSLALLTNSRGYEDCHDVFMGSEECERGGTNDGLFLVNYRKQQTPYWGDTVDGGINLIGGYYNDSSAFFLNAKNEFGFWRIGEKPRVVGKWNCEAPCRCDWRKYGRPWIDGNVLLKMENQNGCPYAVLDTVAGVVKKLELTDEYAWLDGCDDITYFDGDVVCLKALYDEKKYGVYEYSKDGLKDSLIWNDASWSVYTKNVLEIRGKMLTIKHPTTMADGVLNPLNGTCIHFLKPLKTPDFPVRIEYNLFVDSMGSSLSYYPSEDLVVTK